MSNNISFLKNQTYRFALKVGAIFLTTSILGTIAGNFLNNRFGLKPFGTIISLGIFYAITWVIVYRITEDIQKTVNSKQNKDKNKTKS